jgi:1,2-diacylglycerol 3-alpha-glucosyltransferase
MSEHFVDAEVTLPVRGSAVAKVAAAQAVSPVRLLARGAAVPVNIGFFTDSYTPRRSGVVRAVETAARGLRERGHRVCIFAPAYPGHTDEEPDIYRFPSIAAPGHSDFPLAVPYSSAHLRRIRDLHLDLVHSHSPFLLGGLGVWVGRTLKLPLVFTYHTLYAEYAHYAPLVGELTRPFIIAYTTAYWSPSPRSRTSYGPTGCARGSR